MDENKEHLVDQAITRYVKGNSTHQDIIVIAEWLNRDEKNHKILQNISLYWNANLKKTADINYNDVLTKLQSKTLLPEKKEKQVLKFIPILKYAAILMIIMMSFFVYKFITQNDITDHYTYTSGKSPTNINLPDGTSVILNRNSILTYDNSYNGKNREINLKGEAFFEVKENKKKPFIVKLEKTSIRVLGTSFNVISLENSDVVSTTLVEGSILFESPNKIVNLTPGERLTYNLKNDSLLIDVVDVSSTMLWADNVIRYDSLPFSTVVQLLENYYGLHIEIREPALRSTTITGSFDTELSIEQILNLMKNSIGFEWTIDGHNHYVISPLNQSS